MTVSIKTQEMLRKSVRPGLEWKYVAVWSERDLLYMPVSVLLSVWTSRFSRLELVECRLIIQHERYWRSGVSCIPTFAWECEASVVYRTSSLAFDKKLLGPRAPQNSDLLRHCLPGDSSPQMVQPLVQVLGSSNSSSLPICDFKTIQAIYFCPPNVLRGQEFFGHRGWDRYFEPWWKYRN